MPPRPIAIANRHPRLRLDRRAIIRAIRMLDSNHSAIGIRHSAIPSGEISLVFLTDTALARLHADFLQDPSITDVITFPGDPALGTAGEICISVDAALRHLGLNPALNPQPSTLNSFSAELALYLVHGWLHLAGYDDLVPAKKRVMRRAEARALRLLRTRNHIPAFSLRT
ncbi:MAG TPA: rRNA maturation RNase YbeY [Opitutus sp.]|nr:rRNA maturation RNase YbeY [Opitutus sp.]